MAREAGSEQVNVGELQAHQAELHFLVPAGEVEQPLERAAEVLRMGIAELVEELEEVAHLAGAGGELAGRRQAQPVVVTLGERVGAAGLAAPKAASLHVGLREASRAVLAHEGFESSVVVDANVAQPHGAFRTGEPLVGQVLLLSPDVAAGIAMRSEEHTSELQSRSDLVCRLLLEKKKKTRS